MLLARERIGSIRRVLQQRINTGIQVTSLDRQLLAIADQTLDILSTDPRPSTALQGILFADPVGNDRDRYPISQFAVMGTMGPDITGFSALLAPGQAWVFDNIHKGTPDASRELTNAQTCDFILEFWAQARQKITTEVSDPTARNKALNKMRAYVLGHLTHIATDTISHPLVHDYEWRNSPNDGHKFHAELEGELDALVAKQILSRNSTRSGQAWDRWWPTSDQVPPQFFSAYEAALETVYKARTGRRKGYGKFEKQLADLGHPALTPDLVKDGYHLFRHGVVSMGYGYGFWSWWGWLSLLFAPALALPLVGAAMPHGKHIFLKDDEKRTERAWMEFLSTPMAFGLPASIGYGTLLGTLSTHGVEGRYWVSMVAAIVSAILAIVLFATSPVENLDPGFSWTVLFAIPGVIGLVQVILAIVAKARGDRGGRMSIALVFTIPLLLLGVYFLFFGIFPGLAFPDENAANPFESEGFWIAFALWAVTMLFLWIYLPFKLRDARIPETPDGNILKRSFVRLFDDAALHHDQQLADADIPARVYPSGRRKLLKLWWTGSGDLYIKSERYQLSFSPHEDGRDPQVIASPIVPMNLAEFIAFLDQTVKQPGAATTGLLKAAIINESGETEIDYLLPAGAVFSDHGDGEDDFEKHDAEALKFKKIGSSESDSDYILHHSPKLAQSVRYGASGPVPPERGLGDSPITYDAANDGYDYLHDTQKAERSEALMSYAADLSAILCLGATTHLTQVRDNQNNNVEKVYQVFRNWNLDRRRVNEWRTLVAGNAFSEKGADRAGYDDQMLRHQGPADPASWREALLGPIATPTQTAFDRGEATARQLGWVRMMREWMDVAGSPGQNPLDDTTAMRPGNPTNQSLGRAMAWLFDLSDPTLSP